MKYLLFITSTLFLAINSHGQVHNKKFMYHSVYSDSAKTIEIEDSIGFVFKMNSWVIQKKQNDVEFDYYSDTSSIENFYLHHPLKGQKERFIKNVAKREKGKHGWDNYTVFSSSEISGYIDNDSLLWMHSPRSNQFANCQVAPLIEINKKELKKGGKWAYRMIIAKGIPSNEEYVGNLVCKYSVLGKKEYEFNNQMIDCWEIEGIGNHENGKMSTTTFLYNEEIGIFRVDYSFYDQTEIILELSEITTFQ